MATVKIFNKKISWEGLDLSCALERYLNTNNIALELYDEDGEFYKCVTLDARQTLPKSNNAVIYNDKECAGVLSALAKVNMVKVVGKIDIKLMIRDLVVVNTRQFIEIDEDLFLDFARSTDTDLEEFIKSQKGDEEEAVEVVSETEEIVETVEPSVDLDEELHKKLEAILGE